MESGERKELIKEYMFLQALEDPYFQKRRTKDRAAQQVYTYLIFAGHVAAAGTDREEDQSGGVCSRIAFTYQGR